MELFYSQGNADGWWSSTEDDSNVAYFRNLDYKDDIFFRDFYNKSNAFSLLILSSTLLNFVESVLSSYTSSLVIKNDHWVKQRSRWKGIFFVKIII